MHSRAAAGTGGCGGGEVCLEGGADGDEEFEVLEQIVGFFGEDFELFFGVFKAFAVKSGEMFERWEGGEC